MKKVFNLIIAVMLFLPVFVAADTDYRNAINIANDYIRKFDDYEEYFITDVNTPFVFDKVNKRIVYDGAAYREFTHGSFLSKYEYEISNSGFPEGGSRRNSAGKSYLSPGVRYWLVKNDINYYYEELDTKLADSPFVQNGVRVTGLVQPKTTATGRGTSNSPWVLASAVSHDYGEYLRITTDLTLQRANNFQLLDGFRLSEEQLFDGDTIIYTVKVLNTNAKESIRFKIYNDIVLTNAGGKTVSDLLELTSDSRITSVKGTSHFSSDVASIFRAMNGDGYEVTGIGPSDEVTFKFYMKVHAKVPGAKIEITPSIRYYSYINSGETFTRYIDRLVTYDTVTEELPPATVLLMVDMSGSMGTAKLKGVRQSLFSFINYVYPRPGSGSNVNIILASFAGNNFEKYIGMANNYTEAYALKTKIYNGIKTSNTLGGTYFSSAFNLSCAILYGNAACDTKYKASALPSYTGRSKKFLIFLSDGEPTDTSKARKAVYEKFKDKDVEIYAIGYSNNGVLSETDRGHLVLAAREKEDRVYAASIESLMTTFDSIFDDISETIGFVPTSRGSVNLSAQMDNNNFSKISVTVKDKTTGEEINKYEFSGPSELEASSLVTKTNDGKYILNCSSFDSSVDVFIGFHGNVNHDTNGELSGYKMVVDLNGGNPKSGKTYPEYVKFEDDALLPTPTRKINIHYNLNTDNNVVCTYDCNETYVDDLRVKIKNASGTYAESSRSITGRALTFAGWEFRASDVDYNYARQYNSGWVKIPENKLTKRTEFKNLNLKPNSTIHVKANWTSTVTLPDVRIYTKKANSTSYTVRDKSYRCFWNTKPDGTGQFFAVNSKYKLGDNPADEVNLYAICIKASYVKVNYVLKTNDDNFDKCLEENGTRVDCNMNSVSLVDGYNYIVPAPAVMAPGRKFVNWSYRYNLLGFPFPASIDIGSYYNTNMLYAPRDDDDVRKTAFFANWEKCPKGTYNDGSEYDCISCPTGYSTKHSGSTSESNCYVSIRKGEYFDTTDSTVQKCRQGTYSSQEGEFTAGEELFECTACPEYMTTRHTGSTSIDDCYLESEED